MTSLMISKRLETIARYCPKGSKVADIGSDHALLASYLLVKGIAEYVIAGELNEGPYQAAYKQLNSLLARDRASVRKGDGLSVLVPNEVDVVCIAGMGGQLIASILEEGKEKLLGVERLILQPNVGEELVRRWLMENGWQLTAEEIVEEDQVIYEILVASPGDPFAPYQTSADRTQVELLQLGPYLWQEKSSVLLKKWEREQEKWKHILDQVQQSNRPETIERLKQIHTQLEWIEGVIACLRTDKP